MNTERYSIADEVQKIERNNANIRRYKETSDKYKAFVERGLIKPPEPIQPKRGSSVAYGTWPERPNW